MATATLRAGLVIAAVVLGIFVLARAFPTGDETSPEGAPGPIGTTQGASPPAEEEESPPAETPPPDDEVSLEGVRVQVQNGTNTTGLAAETAAELQELGLRIRDGDIGNAATNYDTTTLFFQQGSRPVAEELRDVFFDGEAELERGPADMEPEIEVIVVLGLNYAEAQG